MAVSSYANLFGTTGAGRQGSKAGISTLFGQQAAPQGDDEEMMRRKQQQAQQQAGAAPQPTFAEKQKMGQARPAPPAAPAPASQQAPLVQRVKQQLGGAGMGVPAGPGAILTKTAEDRFLPAAAPSPVSATGVGTMAPMKPPVTLAPSGAPMGAPGAAAIPQAPTGASLAQALQQQLTGMLQPGGYTDVEFERLKAAQEANLQAQYRAEQQALNEELARRGLSASSIGGGRMGDLAGQQARALATMQATLLGQQAEMRQRARETGITAMSDLTRTMLTNEQAQAETRLKEQLGMSEIGGVMYKRGADGQLVPMTDAENKQIETLAAREVARKYGVAEAELTGMFGGQETLPARTQRQNMAIQLAQVLAGSDDPEILKSIMPYIYEAFGITPPGEDGEDEGGDEGGTDTTTGRTATRRTTSTVGQTPGGTTNVPGGTTTGPRVPIGREAPEEAPVEPRGPQKPSLGRPAVEAPEAEPVDMTQPILTAAEEPAAPPPPPPPAATPTPAPAPRALEDELIQILGGAETQPILLPAEEPVPVLPPARRPMPAELPVETPTPEPEPAPAPARMPERAPAPAPAEAPPASPEELVQILTEILGVPPVLLPAEELPAEVPPPMPIAPPMMPSMVPPPATTMGMVPNRRALEEELLALLQPQTVPMTAPMTAPIAMPKTRRR